MRNVALSKMIVNKSPVEIKALPYQTACKAGSWHEFIQNAEEVSWIDYPDKVLARARAEEKNKK
jgi:hypothetical protein